MAWAASISPLEQGLHVELLLDERDVLAGSSPALVMPANSSNSLPKPQLPTFLPLQVGRRR